MNTNLYASKLSLNKDIHLPSAGYKFFFWHTLPIGLTHYRSWINKTNIMVYFLASEILLIMKVIQLDLIQTRIDFDTA